MVWDKWIAHANTISFPILSSAVLGWSRCVSEYYSGRESLVVNWEMCVPVSNAYLPIRWPLCIALVAIDIVHDDVLDPRVWTRPLP